MVEEGGGAAARVVPSSGPIPPPQCQVNAAAVRQERGCTANNAVDAMKSQPCVAPEHQRIAGGEPERAGRIAARGTADAETAGPAPRRRDPRPRAGALRPGLAR